MASRRRVPRFAERAQAILNGHAWPAGFTVTVDTLIKTPTVWVTEPVGYYAVMPLDPYELHSADPARVVPAVVEQFKAIAGQPLYTAQKRRAAQSAADALERGAV